MVNLKSCNELWVPKIYLYPGGMFVPIAYQQKLKSLNRYVSEKLAPNLVEINSDELFLENKTFTYFMKMFCTGSLLTLKIINNSHCQKFWIYGLFFFFPCVLFFFLSYYVSFFIYWVQTNMGNVLIKTLQ